VIAAVVHPRLEFANYRAIKPANEDASRIDKNFKAILAVAGMLIQRPAPPVRQPLLAIVTLPGPSNRLNADI